jgi:hypothetical protein
MRRPSRLLDHVGFFARTSASRFRASDLLWAWLIASVLGGVPSTMHAFFTDGDVMRATRAAASMLGQFDESLPRVLAAATLVHGAVSMFWAFVLVLLLPHRRTILWAVGASAVIAILDLRIIAPWYFPEVASLEFGPQLADHLMWGTCLGIVLEHRRRARNRSKLITLQRG